MLATSPIAAFVATTDPEASRAFYEGVLGLTFVEDNGFALLFDLHGAQLRISRVQEFQPHAFTTLGWDVENVTAAVEALRDRGVTFERYGDMGQDDLGIWHVPGGNHGVAWFKDPDGNLLSVSGPM